MRVSYIAQRYLVGRVTSRFYMAGKGILLYKYHIKLISMLSRKIGYQNVQNSMKDR
jgi:hypothetical protein